MAGEGHTQMLTLRLLGPWEVLVASKPLPRLRTRKGQWLLALLALRHDQDIERDWLAGTLWPESLEEQARTNLRLSLMDLRRALGNQSHRLQAPAPRTLRLDLVGADVDVIAFDRALVRGDSASLQEAVALYRGPLLEGCPEEWCLLERQVREQAYLQARETLAVSALANADTAAAIGHLRQILAIDPFRESAQCSLMQALAAAGDYAAVVQAYREWRLRLHQELRTEPDAKTRALFAQIRQEARDAGKRSISHPEGKPSATLAVGRHGAVPAGAATPPLGENLPTNLPVPWTSFIGREKEREQIRSLLGPVRLLTLTGCGGCGKTRLALQVAAEMLEDYPDGVWLVELASLSAPALIVQTVASAVGVREKPGKALLQTLTEHLQTRHLLLLLDNCEHLLRACAVLAETLLRNCPHLKLLATSREALRLPGEQVYRVPSLPAPDPAQLPRNEKEIATIVSEYDAVRLFVERARLHKPDFTLTPQNVVLVASVCCRLDGLPLAIELAAARVPVLSVEEINARLEDRFRLLTGGSRTALPRQQTLRAALDWSYDLLTQQERQLLQRLSVFAGGWTLEAAEQVTGDREKRKSEETSSFRLPVSDSCIPSHEVLDLLASLVAKSLVITEEREGKTRYRLLETIRAYGWERLQEAGGEKVWLDRHLEYFLKLAEEAEPNLAGAKQAEWLERLESEHDNLRAAISWRRQESDSAEAGLRLAGAVGRFWSVHGYWSEGRGHLQALLSQEAARQETPARAKALTAAGRLAQSQGDYGAACALYEESLAISRKGGDKPGMAASLGGLGIVASHQGNNAVAKSFYEQCLAIHRELGDLRGISISLNNLGNVAYDQGDFGAAKALYEEGLAIDRELGNKRGAASSLGNLGNVAHSQGDDTVAKSFYEQCLAIYRELGDRWGVAISLHNLGGVAHDQGDYGAATALHEESLAIYREIGDRQGTASALTSLGMVAYQQADYVTARVLYEQGLVINREIGNKSGIASSLGNLGNVAYSQGDSGAARVLYEKSLTIRREIGDKLNISWVLLEIADISAQQEQMERAVRLWAAAEVLRESIGSSLLPYMRSKHDCALAAARDSLGETAFEKAWEQGRAMSLDQAIAYALDFSSR